ncbi:unnamed protein product [Musa acuminata subsp. malaccensis]|uniref:(wild Malaysian banana) hypothetical protein n=1 Tax=Musa acuminata subsp. malaccensis TaxID=214687 RepID=A0A804K035_MUSAM|nr:PREDICTED: uncharacterized protein LOC103992773 [Musa acuminata subsp. malaccensis]CAG1857826.1 unnamed protein product [Musa acuminata subsp. malaccensis]
MSTEAMDGRMSLFDTVFSFLEEGGGVGGGGGSAEGGCHDGGDALDSGDDEEGTSHSTAEKKAFWESQQQLLREALSRTSSTEAKLLQRTKDAVTKMQAEGVVCTCSNSMAKECRNCALAYITRQLHQLGYNSALCKSKWTRSPDIPSGEHSYVDVVMETKGGKKGPVRLVVELNFRAEFEMARGSQEYNRLVSFLPEVFVGKSEKLRGVLKIVCAAAKKCMKENKMHMAPWRKHKYMQSKWLGTPERAGPRVMSFPPTVSERQPKRKASMLTFDLHLTAVRVV